MTVTRTMDTLLAFAGTNVTTALPGGGSATNWVADWGSDAEINKLLQKIKDAGDVTSADVTQMIALTGKANIESNFVATLIKEYGDLLKSLLQKMG